MVYDRMGLMAAAMLHCFNNIKASCRVGKNTYSGLRINEMRLPTLVGHYIGAMLTNFVEMEYFFL